MKPIKCKSANVNNNRVALILKMVNLDASNNKIIAQLKIVEKTAGELRALLNIGRQEREKVRSLIGRQKRIIKNMNRADNNE